MTNPTDLTTLSDAELEEVMQQAIRAHDTAQSELRRRVDARLAAAYGHELRLVCDLWSGTESTGRGFRIVWCFYCGERPGWQREHMVPKSRGGSDAAANIVRSCQTCNLHKGRMTIEEYRDSLSRRTGVRHIFFGERGTPTK